MFTTKFLISKVTIFSSIEYSCRIYEVNISILKKLRFFNYLNGYTSKKLASKVELFTISRFSKINYSNLKVYMSINLDWYKVTLFRWVFLTCNYKSARFKWINKQGLVSILLKKHDSKCKLLIYIMNGRIYSLSTMLNIKEPINLFLINVILFIDTLSKKKVDCKLIIFESFSKDV